MAVEEIVLMVYLVVAAIIFVGAFIGWVIVRNGGRRERRGWAALTIAALIWPAMVVFAVVHVLCLLVEDAVWRGEGEF